MQFFVFIGEITEQKKSTATESLSAMRIDKCAYDTTQDKQGNWSYRDETTGQKIQIILTLVILDTKRISQSDYATLGVNANDSEDIIKKAYKNLALINHPNKGGDAKKFIEIKQAYDRIKKGKAKVGNSAIQNEYLSMNINLFMKEIKYEINKVLKKIQKQRISKAQNEIFSGIILTIIGLFIFVLEYIKKEDGISLLYEAIAIVLGIGEIIAGVYHIIDAKIES